MSDALFEVNTEETLVHLRLSNEDVQRSLAEIKRIATLPYLFADATVSPIHITNGEWYRRKLPDEDWRTILAISITEKEIVVHAILLRDDNTYILVQQLYNDLTSE
jgi:hypothetical protein